MFGKLEDIIMAKTTFQGPVKSQNGFQGVGTGNSVSIGAETIFNSCYTRR